MLTVITLCLVVSGGEVDTSKCKTVSVDNSYFSVGKVDDPIENIPIINNCATQASVILPTIMSNYPRYKVVRIECLREE